jgi:hypothetical protein
MMFMSEPQNPQASIWIKASSLPITGMGTTSVSIRLGPRYRAASMVSIKFLFLRDEAAAHHDRGVRRQNGQASIGLQLCPRHRNRVRFRNRRSVAERTGRENGLLAEEKWLHTHFHRKTPIESHKLRERIEGSN